MPKLTSITGSLLLALLCLQPLQAQVTLELNRKEITLDNTAVLTLTVEGGLSQDPPEIPLPDGLLVAGTSRRDVSTPRKRESRIAYTLRATRSGEFTLGPYTLDMNDGRTMLPAVTLTVKEPEVVQTDEELYVTLTSSADSAYVRQTLELSLTFFSLHQIEDITLVDFSTEGFESGEWQEVRVRNRVIRGKTYRVRRFISRITPVRAGEAVLNPTLKVQALIPLGLERNSNFGMFQRRMERRIFRVQPKDPPRLTILAPPAEGRPDAFKGDVGTFSLEASISPEEINVGDPLTLRVALKGRGSLREAQPPEFSDSGDFKVYASRLVQDDVQREGIKVIEQVLIPRHAGVTEVPALEFSYFNPEMNRYETKRAGPFPITVTGTGPNTSGPGLVSSLPENTTPTGPDILGKDLLYLKTRPGRLWTPGGLGLSPGFYAAGAAPFLIYGLLMIGLRLQGSGEKKASAVRRDLRQKLDKLEPLDDAAQLLEARTSLLQDYLRERLSLPAGDLDPDSLAAATKDRYPDDLHEELIQRMRDAEKARFGGPAASSEESAKAFRDFVNRLDREFRS